MKTIHEGISDMIKTLRDTTLNAQRFDEGNAAAGRRVTLVLADVFKECKAIRKAIFTIKKDRKG